MATLLYVDDEEIIGRVVDRYYELMNWIEDTRPHLLERVTFVTGELPDNDGPDRSWKTLRRPVILKPFELSSLAEAVNHAGNRART